MPVRAGIMWVDYGVNRNPPAKVFFFSYITKSVEDLLGGEWCGTSPTSVV